MYENLANSTVGRVELEAEVARNWAKSDEKCEHSGVKKTLLCFVLMVRDKKNHKST